LGGSCGREHCRYGEYADEQHAEVASCHVSPSLV
jgi:hypothetical protein